MAVANPQPISIADDDRAMPRMGPRAWSVRKAAAMRRCLLRAAIALLAMLPSAPSALAAVRAADHGSFGRLVLEWDGAVTLARDAAPAELRLRFSHPISGDLDAAAGRLGRWLRPSAPTPAASELALRLLPGIVADVTEAGAGKVIVDFRHGAAKRIGLHPPAAPVSSAKRAPPIPMPRPLRARLAAEHAPPTAAAPRLEEVAELPEQPAAELPDARPSPMPGQVDPAARAPQTAGELLPPAFAHPQHQTAIVEDAPALDAGSSTPIPIAAEAAADRDRDNRLEAEQIRTAWSLRKRIITAEVALARMEAARPAWRGHPREAVLLNEMGLLRAGLDDMPGAIAGWKEALTTTSDPRLTDAIGRQWREHIVASLSGRDVRPVLAPWHPFPRQEVHAMPASDGSVLAASSASGSLLDLTSGQATPP